MPSQITVRLSADLTEQIDHFAKRLRRKRSDIVRLALEKFISENEGLEEPKSYDQVKGLIGSLSSGIPLLGEAHREYKEILKEVDQIAGKKGRSLFIAEATLEKLERERFLKILEETQGAWTNRRHSDLQSSKDMKDYVWKSRKSFQKRWEGLAEGEKE